MTKKENILINNLQFDEEGYPIYQELPTDDDIFVNEYILPQLHDNDLA